MDTVPPSGQTHAILRSDCEVTLANRGEAKKQHPIPRFRRYVPERLNVVISEWSEMEASV